MQNIERKNISFKSSDGKTTIKGLVYASQKVEPFCVLQISHGMCEFMERYEEFAMYLANHGAVVCGNDHLGHGDSVLTEEELGYFTEKNGRKFVLQDIHTLNNIAHKMYPDLPVILLGHSMGSFLARKYATLWPKTIDGLIISGTGGPNPMAGAGIALTNFMAKAKGDKYRSKLVNKVAVGQSLKKIDNPATDYDWISRDPKIVDIYANDPNCTFIFTVNGFHELFSALKDVSSLGWAREINKTMPVYIFSGDADPVGDYGKGVITVFTWLKEAGVEDVTMKLYSEGRHEMLNEINRDEVYADVLEFLQEHWKVNTKSVSKEVADKSQATTSVVKEKVDEQEKKVSAPSKKESAPQKAASAQKTAASASKEKVSEQDKKVSAPIKKETAPKKTASAPKTTASASKEKVSEQDKKVSAPSKKESTPKKTASSPKTAASAPQKTVSASKEKVSDLEEK